MDLGAFEACCEQLYTNPDPQARKTAEIALVQLSTTPACIPQCQFVLDNSAQPYAQLVAANALRKLVVLSWNNLSAEQRLGFRNYLLAYLANHGPSRQQFICRSLVQLVAAITKLGWLEAEEYQQIVAEVDKFLHASPQHLVLGLQLLHELVGEMNSTANARSLTLHRKVAGGFRDACLFTILKSALATLQQLGADTAAEQEKIREQALQLVLACMGYDFIGTTLDEATEELGTVQVPSSWRATMEDAGTVKLFYDIYATAGLPNSATAVEVLVFLASLRRSLFSSDEERAGFLTRMMRGTLDVLQSQRGLGEHQNYHELCRLLARLKANYQLFELVQVDCYSDWIATVAAFTIDSFKHWQWASNSVYYLLSLWSRLVASMPYLKGDVPSQLDSFVPQVITAFIHSRMELVRALQQSAEGELDDPLDNEEQLNEQLDTLPSLCRFQLQQVSSFIVGLFEPSAKLYATLLAQPVKDGAKLAQCEGELAWLVYIIGTVLGSHLTPSSNSDTQQLVDAQLTCAVLQLLPLLNEAANVAERGHERPNQRLELALLFFMQQFRKVYVGDQATASSKVYALLQEQLALGDHLAVLAVLVDKVVVNLKLRCNCADITEKTLLLLADLAGGYSSGKMLLKLEAVHLVLAKHTEFPFLGAAVHGGQGRMRTSFYSTLCKLLFADEHNLRFKTFMEPFTALLTELSENVSLEMFREERVRTALVGALRDLRGIASACTNRRTYGLFFEWVYPAFTPVLQLAARTHFADPEVLNPLLKLYGELVHNKGQRLVFDASSPNGILLFRDASAIVVTYGTRVLEQPAADVAADPYRLRYKGISQCLVLLTRVLSGNYVNFGVFQLYGDSSLADCLEVAFKLCLSMPLQDVIAYPKVCRTYFTLMELLMRNHTQTFAALDTPVLRHICASLQEGLKAHEVAISSQCAAALEHLAAFHFRTMSDERDGLPKQQLAAHLQREPKLFSEQLAVLLQMVVFEDCANQWSLSRPLLALVLTNEAAFGEWQAGLLAQQAASLERQQKLAAAFQKLMAEVTPSLEAKNRDKFTQNLTTFRHEMKQFF